VSDPDSRGSMSAAGSALRRHARPLQTPHSQRRSAHRQLRSRTRRWLVYPLGPVLGPASIGGAAAAVLLEEGLAGLERVGRQARIKARVT
jgi:hypothetical protein